MKNGTERKGEMKPMKKLLSILAAAILLCISAVAVAETSTDGNIFEIRKLILDENKKVTSVIGVYETLKENEDGELEPVYGEEEFTYPLAAGYKLIAPVDPEDPSGETKEFDDLYQWYVQTYLNGTEPEGGLTFTYDYPADQQLEAQTSFWFITDRIELNDAGEIVTLTDYYVPWS